MHCTIYAKEALIPFVLPFSRKLFCCSGQDGGFACVIRKCHPSMSVKKRRSVITAELVHSASSFFCIAFPCGTLYDLYSIASKK